MSTVSQIPRHIINMANYDAHSLEAMDQTLLNLSNLEEIGSDIFNKIFTKIQQVHTKMKEISERINASKGKIDALNNVNKPIVIQSPTKYIKNFSQSELEQNKNLFAEYILTPNLYKTDQSIYSKQHHTPQEQGKQADIAKLDEYLKLVNDLYGKIKQKKALFEGRDAIQNQQFEGLGQIPKNFKYIDSLLTFNTNQNPYTHYSSIDNMKTTETAAKLQKAQKQEQYDLEQSAPMLISQNMQMQTQKEQKYIYRPQTKAAPQINMKSNLGLGNIVDIQQIIPEEDYQDDFQMDQLKSRFDQDDGMDLDNNLSAQPAGRFSNMVGEDLLQAQQHLGQIKNKTNQSQAVQKEEPKQYFTFNTFQNQSPAQPSNPSAPQQAQAQQSQTTNLLAMPAPINIPQAPSLTLNLSVAPPQPPPLQQQPNSSIPAPPPLGVNPGAPAPPSISAPKLNLPAPKAPQAPAKAAAGGGSRADLLASIRCADPMARLKKVSTLIDKGKPLPPVEEKGKAGAKAPPKKQSHMELLRQQVMLRAGALNRKNKKKDSSDESDSD